MFTARKKIAKEKGAEPDDFEESVAQVGDWACILCQDRRASVRLYGGKGKMAVKKRHW